MSRHHWFLQSLLKNHCQVKPPTYRFNANRITKTILCMDNGHHIACNIVANANSKYATPTVVHIGPYEEMIDLEHDIQFLKDDYARKNKD